MQGITVVISDRINYAVNSKFSKMDPAAFWNYIANAYGLVWFFDDKIMFVYPNAEFQTSIFRMDTDGIGPLSVILSRLGFVPSDFSFRDVGAANVLIVTVPPQYINVINDIATKFVPSKISDTSIVKIIPLKYAWAYNMPFNYTNGSISVPDVSNMLQSIVMGQQLFTALSPFNINVRANQKQIQYQQMAGILDDTPQYAKDINNNIKNVQKDGKGSDKGKNNLFKIEDFNAKCFCDLGTFRKQLKIAHTGLRNLAAIFLSVRISKKPQLTDWTQKVLTPQQISYAATDAWTSREIFLKMLQYLP
jgi:type II secretory pathway component GspD/PulD (secretin)